MVDASLGEIMTTCEKITWLLSEGERWLKPEYRYTFLPITLSASNVLYHFTNVLCNIPTMFGAIIKDVYFTNFNSFWLLELNDMLPQSLVI